MPSRLAVIAVFVYLPSVAWSQGLGQAAEKERQRRAARQGSGGVPTITAEDLNPEKEAWKDWQPFTSREHRFSVSLPAYPTMVKDNDQSPLGIVRRTTYEAVAGDMTYGVVVADYPEQAKGVASDVFFNAVRDGMLKYLRAPRLRSERPVRLGSYPGREFSLSTSAGLLTSRAYLSGERVYLLMVLSPSEKEVPRADPFFDSLAILK